MISLFQDIAELLFGSKRQEAFKHFAYKKEFSYQRRTRLESLPLEVLRMDLMTQSKKATIKGLIAKPHEAWQTVGHIFDLTQGSEFGEKTTTVFLFQCHQMKLPPVKITPKSSLGKLGSIFSSGEWSHIDPNFDRAFAVTSDDLNRMRILLTIQFAEEMLKLEDFVLEGNGSYFILYKKNHKVDIIDMDNVYDTALHLVDIILH